MWYVVKHIVFSIGIAATFIQHNPGRLRYTVKVKYELYS